MATRPKLTPKTKLVDGIRVNIADGAVAQPSTIGQEKKIKSKGYDVGKVPTVISDNTIREDVIPGIKADAQQMLAEPQGIASQQETPQGEQTQGTDEYSQLYSSIMGTTPTEDPYYDTEMKLLEDIKKTSDLQTRSYLDSLSQVYNTRRAQQEAVTGAQKQGAQQMLFRGGGYRSGSGSQVLSGIERAGIRELSTLDAEEQQLKASALAAQTEQDYKLLGDKLDLMKEKRAEKLNTVSSMWEAIVEERKTTQKGIDEILKDAAKNGAPAHVQESILAATNQSEAVAAAGDWLATGSGVIGEYLFYKREAEAAGQTPLSFNAYADMDANRKRSVTIMGGTGTYNSNQEKVISRVDNSIANNPMYKKYNSMITFANNVNTALDSQNGVSDIAAINQFQKVIDEGAVTRDQDVKLIQSAQSLSNQLSLMTNRLKSGQQLSQEQRDQMRDMTNQMLAAQKSSVDNDPFIQSKRKELERNSIDPADTILGGIDENTGGIAGDLVKQEREAENKVIDIASSNPEAESAIRPLLEQNIPYLEIVEALPEYFQ